MYMTDPLDPYGDTGSTGGTTDSTGGTTGDTGGSSASGDPYGDPDDNGWWEFINGVWRWVTEPAPRTVASTG